jgi:transcriptional regulator with XRE-family HTH domain
MEMFATRLRQRARQLGISNSEAARRAGLDERRYQHYISGRSEPNLATILQIARALDTHPNDLLGVAAQSRGKMDRARLIKRLQSAAKAMSDEALELTVVQAEAVALVGGKAKA